jgi:diguanylate cyclase (GGDEF)-like protein/PAS domain S-box-containing protein
MHNNEEFSAILFEVLAQSIDGVVIFNHQYKIIFFNQAAEALWGIKSQAACGEHIDNLLPPEMRGQNFQDPHNIAALIGARKTLNIRHADGSERWVDMSLSGIVVAGVPYYSAIIRDVSHAHITQERNRMLALVADQTDKAILITDNQWKILYVNDGFSRKFGYTIEHIKGVTPIDLLAPNTDIAVTHAIRHQLMQGEAFDVEEIIVLSNGDRMWCSVTSNPVFDDNGMLMNTVSVLTDITQAKMYQVLQHRVLDAMAHESPLQSIMDLVCREIERILPECLTSILCIDDRNTLYPLASPSLPASYSQAIQGLPIGDCVGSCGTAAFRGEEVLAFDMQTDPLWADYMDLILPLSVKSCWSIPIKSTTGRVLGTLGFYHKTNHTPSSFERQLVNIIIPLCALAMEREESRTHIRQLAFYDSLTELPNRALLHAESERALQDARRNKTNLAVLFIDLDRFKQVNDSLGHPAGDVLLRLIADRLNHNRQHLDIVGRLSGDEFVVVLPQCDSTKISNIIEEVKQAISQPCNLNGVTLVPSASIGVSLFPNDGHDMGTLLHRADMAMYQAKSLGRGNYSFYSHALNQSVQERHSLESALRTVLETKGLQLHYQPQINLKDGSLYGVEALARWHHAQWGEISPARFVPVAEECGLMVELGYWAIRQACWQLSQWRSQGLCVPAISVNLSPTSFHRLDLPNMIGQTLRDNGLAPKDLTLEITENILVDTNPTIMKTIQAVHGLGIRLSMDDFGTGYSSLSYLRRLPIQELKLDRSFVKDIEHDHTSQTLSSAVIRIGESLQLTVVAEGIETLSQHNMLKNLGYHVAQGYLHARPMEAQAFSDWLITHQSPESRLKFPYKTH